MTAGHPRYTFGIKELLSGVDFIPAMVGMFAVSELMRRVTETAGAADFAQTRFKSFHRLCGPVLRFNFNIWRGNTIGTAIGILPGAGADIAAWISYSVGKKFSKHPSSSAGAPRKAWSMPVPPTTPPSRAPGCRRWCSAFRATASPLS